LAARSRGREKQGYRGGRKSRGSPTENISPSPITGAFRPEAPATGSDSNEERKGTTPFCSYSAVARGARDVAFAEKKLQMAAFPPMIFPIRKL